MLLRLRSGSKSFLFLAVYRPPSNDISSFISEFSTLLEDIASIHLDTQSSYSNSFAATLKTFGLQQHISSSTHSSGHTLDLLITRDKMPITDFGVYEQSLSDHSAIFCKLPIVANSLPTRSVKTYRKLSSIDINAFSDDIKSSSLYSSPSSTVANYSQQLNSVLLSLLDKHAPLKTISCRANPRKPFITDEILEQKSKRSKLESIFRKDKKKNPPERQNPELRDNYLKQRKLVDRMITTAKSSYFRNMISQNHDCPKKLWGTLDSLLGRNIPKSLPSTDSPSELATSFLNFFDDKISKLCSSIPKYFNSTDPSVSSNMPKPPELSNFVPASSEEIRQLILSATFS